MEFGREVVNNSKIENEKSAQKRQFYDFSTQKLLVFESGFGCKKGNCN